MTAVRHGWDQPSPQKSGLEMGLYQRKCSGLGPEGTEMGQNEGRWLDICNFIRTPELSSCKEALSFHKREVWSQRWFRDCQGCHHHHRATGYKPQGGRLSSPHFLKTKLQPLRASWEGTAGTLISDFQPPKLWENRCALLVFCLSVVFCQGSPSKLMHHIKTGKRKSWKLILMTSSWPNRSKNIIILTWNLYKNHWSDISFFCWPNVFQTLTAHLNLDASLLASNNHGNHITG